MARKTKTEKTSETAPRTAAAPVMAKPVVMTAAPEPVPNQPASDETRANRPPTHEEIARRAHELWAKRGGVGGNAQEDWLRAEQELRARR